MKKLNVLIVEDNMYAADINLRQIRKCGFDVDSMIVTTSKSMIEALNLKKWDLVLCDNFMPDLDANKALEIRNRFNPELPFYIVSEQIGKRELDEAFSEGCNGFIPKEDCTELRNLVDRLFNL